MKAKSVTFEGEHFSLHVAQSCYTLRLRDDDMGPGPILVSTSSRREFDGRIDEMQRELASYGWEIQRGYGIVNDIDPDSFKPEAFTKAEETEEENNDG